MKQIIAILAVLAITTGAMAAPGVGVHPAPRPVVIVHQPYYGGFGYRPYYSPWGYNAFYNPYGYGYGYRYAPHPSKLDLNIEEINNDYSEQISDVRHDKSIGGKERRSQIRDLRHERDDRIIQAKKDYYHPRTHIGTTVMQDNNDANNVQ